MTTEGGATDEGVIYRFDLVGGGYQVIHDFENGEGTRPFGGLTAVPGWLYGMASDVTFRGVDDPPNSQHGLIFRIRSDGSEYQILHRFEGALAGGHPYGSLTHAGASIFYGSTFGEYQNLDDVGVLCRFDAERLEYEVLHVFANQAGDGSKPNGDLVLSPDGQILYGITHGTSVWFDVGSPYFGESFEYGTLFQIGIDGTGFEVLHAFDNASGRHHAGTHARPLRRHTFRRNGSRRTVHARNESRRPWDALRLRATRAGKWTA
jgi:uncharacterized repeat protein (TIGR03803 family)